MAELIKMPRLSDTMEEGTVASWFKKVGDKVSEGDILAEIETDKATMEFESFYDGTLLYIGVKEGESTKVDEPLAIIGEANEDYKSLLDDAKKSEEVIQEKIQINEKPEVQEKIEIIEEDKEIEVVKEELEIENVPELISKTTASTKRIFISPLARKLANERGISISEIKGTGENGRIIKSDVENHTSSSKDTKSKTFISPFISFIKTLAPFEALFATSSIIILYLTYERNT